MPAAHAGARARGARRARAAWCSSPARPAAARRPRCTPRSNEINTPDRKIITVEDPVEYRLPGINQVQVHDKIDLSFARVLRSALRQDPDVILVGEMRDQETAEIGLRAAMTGHLVLSTLHTNDAASTPMRLLDMGVPPLHGRDVAAASCIAQRLVRVICESCTQPAHADAAGARVAARTTAASGGRRMPAIAQGLGCSHCNGTGYRGRTGSTRCSR